MQNYTNPPEMPMGFGMQLMQHPKAMDNFGRLSNAEKHNIIGHIQASTSGGEAKTRVTNMVNRLAEGQTRV